MRFPHPTFSALRMAVSFLLICATSAVAQFGPDEPVTVHRDTADVPHIFGSTDAAAFYAFGRSQMSDLPVTTALNLASAAGESALYLGAGPGDGPGFYIDADLETLHWRIPAIASQQLAQLDSSTFRRLRAYVAGVNRARNDWLLDLSPLVLNTEPVNLDLSQLQSLLGRSVSVHDVLCHGLQMNGGPSMIAARDLAENYIPEDLLKTASNGWLIGSGASSSGNPITLADPHIGFETSPRYRAYFAQIKGTNHHACGISFPGWPCITIGFNDAISWVMTSNNPDILDVWEVDLEPGGQHYLLDGIPTPMIRMPLNVSYLNGNGGVSVYQEWRSYAGSVEYPVLDESNDNGVTRVRFARASFTTGPSIFEFFLKLGDATTLPEAFQAMQLNAVTYSNFLVADTNGAMGYIWNGRIPRRGEATPGTTWAEVQDGSSSAYRWLGFHSTNELPSEVISGQQSANLAISDQIWINNNVRADLVRPGTSLDLSNFPEYMVHAAQTQTNFRQLRAVELLRDPGVPISTAENEIISTDQRDNWTVAMMPLIETAAARYGLHASPDVRDLFVKLRAWDGDATRDSEVAVYALLDPSLVRGLSAQDGGSGLQGRPRALSYSRRDPRRPGLQDRQLLALHAGGPRRRRLPRCLPRRRAPQPNAQWAAEPEFTLDA